MYKDHPRTRGVYGEEEGLQCCDQGSSPHTRGLLKTLNNIRGLGRIIPAHAGFTHATGVYTGSRYGSSPHTRGLPDMPLSRTCLRADHPRTRGVYSRTSCKSPRAGGSSPHTRGLPHKITWRLYRRGIIPAHAGFTKLAEQEVDTFKDHPRTRGVYRSGVRVWRRGRGSSPHTRGLPLAGADSGAQ